ncbi:hypothetical protein [Spirilliplanes yamanashiensis]|uniref:Uncharacterized protein n=1 Tax=Spirilliplanes yamanashiensis TaxID=42233 RepID=A0A8J3Y6R8_9ACTN|nr:hypothetical protein [Spirilliplanes yamanashiensis]GIJ02333.1 hypothetical protein Sya03_16850 [Spirilliplanes yamanashiensis]
MTAATALAGTAQPASAASHRSCTIVKHSSTSGVTTIGGGTATVVAEGLKLTTTPSVNADKVTWKTSFKPVAAGTVREVSYETVKQDKAGAGVSDSALPAYHLYVRTAQGDATLVFEPYFYLMSIGAGSPQRGVRTEWNVLDGPLWTPSTTLKGLPKTAGGPATLTFAQVAAANPGMTVTGLGFGLGTYNPGVVSTLDEQRFATTKKCTEHQWSTGFKNGSWWPGWLR